MPQKRSFLLPQENGRERGSLTTRLLSQGWSTTDRLGRIESLEPLGAAIEISARKAKPSRKLRASRPVLSLSWCAWIKKQSVETSHLWRRQERGLQNHERLAIPVPGRLMEELASRFGGFYKQYCGAESHASPERAIVEK